MTSRYDIEPYDPCPCGSGNKYKFCCAAKAKANRHGKFPIGTVACYGPNDKDTTKVVASVILREFAEPIMERWVSTNVLDDPKVAEAIKRHFAMHGVKSVVATTGNVGCPHEEGIDFPSGVECPFCPFWTGKQGIVPRDGEEDVWLDDEDDDPEDWSEDDEDDVDADAHNSGREMAIARLEAALGDETLDFDQAMDKLLAHLQANMVPLCEVTGEIEFGWEEPYVLGERDEEEYERLRREQPCGSDMYQLIRISRGETSPWMACRDDLAAHVCRISDGKQFVLGLSELIGTPADLPAAYLLDAYRLWFENNH